jgi:FkbM family methyltransferase
MYQIHSWWLPDTDTHFASMLEKNMKKGGGPVYQEPVRKASINLCSKKGLALDIGANVGLWTRDLTTCFERVIAFEPVEQFRECLARNVPPGNWQISPMALGDQVTTINMIITEGNTGHSHVDQDSLGQGSTIMITLDEFFANFSLPPIDYIKLDCEGYENKILNGGKKVILRDRPIMVIEHKKHKDVGHSDTAYALDTLQSWGAKILTSIRNDYILGW